MKISIASHQGRSVLIAKTSNHSIDSKKCCVGDNQQAGVIFYCSCLFFKSYCKAVTLKKQNWILSKSFDLLKIQFSMPLFAQHGSAIVLGDCHGHRIGVTQYELVQLPLSQLWQSSEHSSLLASLRFGAF